MRLRKIFVLIVALSALLAACGSSDSEETDAATDETEEAAPQETEDPPEESEEAMEDEEDAMEDEEEEAAAMTDDFVIGFASPILSNPDQATFGNSIESASASVGIGFNSTDANLSVDKQLADVDTLVSQGVSGLITWALDPAGLGPSLERAQDAGIPVVGLSTMSPLVVTNIAQERFTCADENSHGEQVANYIAGFKPGGNVLVIGPPPVPILESMTVCFSEAAEAAGLTVLDRGDNVNDTAATATPIVADLLTKHTDVDAIWAYNDSTALGASAALRSAGFEVFAGEGDGVVVTGGNGGIEAVEAVEAGVITATYDSNTPAAGQAAARALYQILSGEVAIEDMPAEIVVPVTLVDFSNFEDYVPYEDRDLSLN